MVECCHMLLFDHCKPEAWECSLSVSVFHHTLVETTSDVGRFQIKRGGFQYIHGNVLPHH